MKNIQYHYQVYISFVKNDEALLARHFQLKSFWFQQQHKIKIPFQFIAQLYFIIRHLKKTSCFVVWFGGYHSLLPSLIGKLFKIPCIIILGGTDCASFPSIGYGNFRKKLLGKMTEWSFEMATHLCPVDQSLVLSKYTYQANDFSHQGYKFFCPKNSTPNTAINIGYDAHHFICTTNKIKNSFVTVAQLNNANYYRKGIDLIFAIAPRFPQCKFTIVGNTNQMQYISIPNNITLLPFVAYEKLIAVYSEHQFYLQLSIMEGFPSAPCEAMLCECIPIVSNVGALPQIVGNTGFILPKRDIEALVLIIEEAIKNPKIGLDARERIIENYPISTRFRLIQLINQLIIKTHN